MLVPEDLERITRVTREGSPGSPGQVQEWLSRKSSRFLLGFGGGFGGWRDVNFMSRMYAILWQSGAPWGFFWRMNVCCLLASPGFRRILVVVGPGGTKAFVSFAFLDVRREGGWVAKLGQNIKKMWMRYVAGSAAGKKRGIQRRRLHFYFESIFVNYRWIRNVRKEQGMGKLA